MKLPEVNSERWLSLEDLPGEEWRETLRDLGEGIYYVSNYGRVKQEEHCIEYGTSFCTRRKKVLRQSQINGYWILYIYRKCTRYRILVHRIVGDAFLEDGGERKFIDHLNGNRGDNRAVNLRWATHKENLNNPVTKAKLNKGMVLRDKEVRNLFVKSGQPISKVVPQFVHQQMKNPSQIALQGVPGGAGKKTTTSLKRDLETHFEGGLGTVDDKNAKNNFNRFANPTAKKFPNLFPSSEETTIFEADQTYNDMTYSFYLKDKSKDKTALVLIVFHKGKKYRRQIGLSVDPSEWKRQRTKNADINRKLRLIEVSLTERLDQFSTEQEVLDAIDAAIEIMNGREPVKKKEKKKGEGSKVSFWTYFEDWANRPSTQIRQRKLCYRNIEKFMGRSFDWGDVDSAFHFRLVKKMQDAGFALNYQWKMVSQLKTVMSEGYKLKFHTNTEYQNFKTRREDPDTVYLTKEEVERLWEYKPKGALDRKARDLFLLGVYTAARFSDYSRLTTDMIQDGIIRFHQVKTGESVLIPASPRVLEILSRNGGKAPDIAQQHLNEWIKKVCEACGIDTPVEVSKTEGAVRKTEVKKKYELVSSHTARRTGASLLYMTGVPLQQVMLITGHKDEKSIRRYLRLTKEENVALLKDNPFFK